MPLPDCEKFVMKFPPLPFVHGLAAVLQIMNCTLNGGPPGVPVKLKVKVRPLPAGLPLAPLGTAQSQLPVLFPH